MAETGSARLARGLAFSRRPSFMMRSSASPRDINAQEFDAGEDFAAGVKTACRPLRAGLVGLIALSPADEKPSSGL